MNHNEIFNRDPELTILSEYLKNQEASRAVIEDAIDDIRIHIFVDKASAVWLGSFIASNLAPLIKLNIISLTLPFVTLVSVTSYQWGQSYFKGKRAKHCLQENDTPKLIEALKKFGDIDAVSQIIHKKILGISD